MKITESINPGARETAPPEPRKGPLAHVLLVDDDPIFRSLARLSLKQLGHPVSVADDAITAMEAARQNEDIRLLITDIIMPGMNGLRLGASLRAILPGCKVLYTSGSPLKAPSAAETPGDPVHFLRKPFTRAQLAAAIEAALAGE